MTHIDAASAVVGAPPSVVFDALITPEAREAWLPPAGMTGRFEAFDPRPGGGYVMVLRYDDPTTAGKSGGNADVVRVRFTAVQPPSLLVEEADFVSDDPALAGTMTMTWELRAVSEGTRVEITATDVPDGISSEDHAAAFTSTLDNLGEFLRVGSGENR